MNELKLMIPERAILISTNENDIVFDPFGGGGSTYQAAEIHNRYWIGTELYDSAHIQQRLEEMFAFAVGKKPEYDLGMVFKRNEDYKDAVLQRGKGKSMPVGAG